MKREEKIFGVALSAREQRKAQGLYRRYTRKYGDPAWQGPELRAWNPHPAAAILGIQDLRPGDGEALRPQDGVILGTIRMGFGHYRMSMALASAATSMGVIPYWLDFLGVADTPASKIIHELEGLYSFGSRLSQRFPWFNHLVWEKAVLEMGRPLWGSKRDRLLGEFFAPLCRSLPPDMPFVAVHPWAAHGALAAGRKNVVNAIPDNYPLGFHLAEGSVHTVQSPSAYLGFRMLQGMSRDQGWLGPEAIKYTAHYVDHELVSNVEHDNALRFKRLRNGEPRRFLLTIGGAGAQTALFLRILTTLKPLIEQDGAAVFVNLGDHRSRYEELSAKVKAAGLHYGLHQNWDETSHFAQEALEGTVRGLHFFIFDDPFPAVYATNVLMRASDVLVTKPSELAFYPVPKLFIQRVGRHEAWGAMRGAEAGDGTFEVRSERDLDAVLHLLVHEKDLLHLYCSNIIKNKEIGLYDGAYNVIKLALAGRPH